LVTTFLKVIVVPVLLASSNRTSPSAGCCVKVRLPVAALPDAEFESPPTESITAEVNTDHIVLTRDYAIDYASHGKTSKTRSLS
jgi:hypothetical protein